MKNHYKDAIERQNDALYAENAVKKGNCTLGSYTMKSPAIKGYSRAMSIRMTFISVNTSRLLPVSLFL